MGEEINKLEHYIFEFNNDVSEDSRTDQLVKLSKYDDYKIENDYTDWFGKMPNTVFEDVNLNNYDIALYAYLISRAHIRTQQGDIVVGNIAIETIMAEFNIDSRNKKKISESLRKLKDQDYMDIENTFKVKGIQFINVIFIDVSENFCKIYKSAVDKIIKLSKNINLINRLSTYSAIRSFVYEGESNSRVAYALTNHIMSRSSLKKTTCLRELDWLVDQNILACFNCIISRREGGKKKYYSDIKDHTQLKWFVASRLRDGKVRNVVN